MQCSSDDTLHIMHIEQVVQETSAYELKGFLWNEMLTHSIPRPNWIVSTYCHVYQSVGCFLQDVTGCIWAVTDASHFRITKCSSGTFAEINYNSSLGKLNAGPIKQWNNVFLHGTKAHVAKNCLADLKSVNIVAIPLEFKYEMPINFPDPRNVFIFNGSDHTLLQRNVYKSGNGTRISLQSSV